MVRGSPSVCLAAVLVVGVLAPLSSLAMPAFVAVPATFEDDETPVLDVSKTLLHRHGRLSVCTWVGLSYWYLNVQR